MPGGPSRCSVVLWVGSVPLQCQAPADAKGAGHALEAVASGAQDVKDAASQGPHELMRREDSDALAAGSKGDTGRRWHIVWWKTSFSNCLPGPNAPRRRGSGSPQSSSSSVQAWQSPHSPWGVRDWPQREDPETWLKGRKQLRNDTSERWQKVFAGHC